MLNLSACQGGNPPEPEEASINNPQPSPTWFERGHPSKTPAPTPSPAPTPQATATAIPRGRFEQSSFFSAVLNHEFEYQVYLPPGYDQDHTRYPVIYLLHGRGDTMYGWQYIQRDLDRMINEGAIPPMIAVLPDVPASKGASYFVDSAYTVPPIVGEPVESAFLQDFVPHIDATYRTIATRSARAIAGYSMGGYAATRYPLAHPEIFSAALILSPAVYVPLPPPESSSRIFGAFGHGEQVFVDAIWQDKNYPALLPSFETAGLPLFAFIAVGDDEWRNPSPENYEHDLDFEAARLYNAFAHTRYIVAQFRVLNGGHDWDVWQPAFIEGLTWIARHLEKPVTD
jgi:enterochelin esterase-like enzyme